MDRRRAAALILGLGLCLLLLGRWALRPDAGDHAPAERAPLSSSAAPAPPSNAIEPAPARATTPNENAAGSGIFRGRVIDAVTRQPVREFDLEFHAAAHPGAQAPVRQSFQTKDGRFEQRGLATTTWTVLATARGYQRFEINGVAISSGKPTSEIVMPMRAGHSLRGRVFDESTNAPIAGATIMFREGHVDRYEGDFRMRPSTHSQKDGAFVLDGVTAGPIILSTHANDYAAREISVTVSSKTPPVEIALSAGGTIAGYLAGADGITPVAGRVSLANIDESSAVSITTGTAGEFVFKRLAASRYRLSGRGEGMSGERDFTLAHNERLEGIVLAMSPGQSIRGVVSGLRPEEIKLTSVRAQPEGGFNLLSQASVDERGAFTLSGVAPGRVTVTADVDMRRQISKKVAMPADTDLTVNLEFPRGARLMGHVTRGGKPLAGVSLSPRILSPTAQQDLFIYEVRSSASGEYAIEDLPPGEYAVRVDSYRSPNVRVDGDTVFDIDVPAAHLAGRLLEEGGKVPVVGASVDIWSAQPGAKQIRLSDRSDHFGQFALRGLQPGDFVLSIYKPGYELYRAPIAYGSPVVDMAISMRPAKGVELRIRDASSGKAVSTVDAIEIINGQPATIMELHVDEDGVGYIPSALAGSSLRFSASGYIPIFIDAWNGEALDVNLRQQPTR